MCQLALAYDLEIRAAYIPGVQNNLADGASRWSTDRSALMLNRDLFRSIDGLWGPHNVDLFAARENAQLPNYFAWANDPMAAGIDAFSTNWAGKNAWINPPFALIGRILQKILDDQATVTLLCPLWPTQAWFPNLLAMVCDYPRLLPRNGGVFWKVDSNWGPLPPASWGHIVVRVSGSSKNVLRFHRQLWRGPFAAGAILPDMTLPGNASQLSPRDVAVVQRVFQSIQSQSICIL